MRLFPFYITLFLAVLSVASCGRGCGEVNPALAAVLRSDTVNPYAGKGVPAPDEGCTRMRVRSIGPFSRAFNDSNYRHLEYARAGGFKPIRDDSEAWENGKGLVRIASDRYCYVDSLTHSYPYLRPHAARLLAEIGHRFADSLAARGGGAYRPKVTSVLRSPMTVGKLRRVNRNATAESAHQYATTFDISYSKFICDDASGTRRTFEDLKNLLAEIIYDLRSEGRCLVKHERKQACFHITAAPEPEPNTL